MGFELAEARFPARVLDGRRFSKSADSRIVTRRSGTWSRSKLAAGYPMELAGGQGIREAKVGRMCPAISGARRWVIGAESLPEVELRLWRQRGGDASLGLSELSGLERARAGVPA